MPQIVFTATALRDLERLREFLRSKNPPAAQRAASAIINTIRKLESYPDIGRPIDDNDFSFRELLIDFGGTGYLAMYQYDGGERLTVLCVRHQKEAGY